MPPPRITAATFTASAISPSRDGGINCIALVAPEADLLAQFTPRRRDLVRLCARYFRRLAVVGGTIDLDDERALAIAKRDRAWRAFLPQAKPQQPSNPATQQPGHAVHRVSRGPPNNV